VKTLLGTRKRLIQYYNMHKGKLFKVKDLICLKKKLFTKYLKCVNYNECFILCVEKKISEPFVYLKFTGMC